MTKPTALGAFIFAGGFSLGVRKYFDVLAHLEDGPFGAATSMSNLGIEVHTKPSQWPIHDYDGIQLLYANPPCAPFSAAGNITAKRRQALGVDVKYKADGRVACIHKTFEVFRALRPPLFVFESVARAFSVGRPLVDGLAQDTLAEGYNVTHVLVNAVDCGVPQFRPRYFFVAHRIPLYLSRPDKPHVTCRQALTGIEPSSYPRMGKDKMALYPHTRPGESFSRAFERQHGDDESKWERNRLGQVKGRPGFVHIRANWDRPVGAISGAAHLYHPDEQRPFSVKEMQVLCGYPADYVFTGSLSNQYAEVAKGVTPPTAAWLARHLFTALKLAQEQPEQSELALGKVTVPVLSIQDFRKEVLDAA